MSQGLEGQVGFVRRMIAESDFPNETPDGEFPAKFVLKLWDDLFAAYKITEEDEKISFVYAVYNKVFINGTSDKARFTTAIKTKDGLYDPAEVNKELNGISRKFFRSCQAHAYEYLMADPQKWLREEMNAKYIELRSAHKAYIVVDWFTSVIPKNDRYASEKIKHKRLSGGRVFHSPSHKREAYAAPIANDGGVLNSGFYNEDEY